MKKLHYFPFYYLDWLSSSNVMMMTYEEKGLFIDMLCRCYNDDGLPDDDIKLQRLFKCDATVLKSVKEMFYSVDGLLKNKKLDSVCDDQSKMFADKAKAGKASAKARADKRLHKSTAVEHVLNPVATEAQQNPTNKTKQNRTKQSKVKSKPKKFTPPELFEVKAYFREKGYTEQSSIKAFNYYDVADWVDSKGNQIKNWKQKMQGVWFKDENKASQVVPISEVFKGGF